VGAGKAGGRKPGPEKQAPEKARGLTFFTPGSHWPDCGNSCKKSRHIPVPRNRSIDYCGMTSPGYKAHYPFFVHGMLASGDVHAQLGWDLRFVDDPFQADIVVCAANKAEQFLSDERRTRRQLVIGVELGDSAFVQTPLQTLSRPEVLAVVKHHSWRFPRQLCKDPVKETILETLAVMRESPSDSERGSLPLGKVTQLLVDQGCKAIPDDAFRKVHTSIPSWLTVQMGSSWLKRIKHPRHPEKRPIDVLFMGAVSGNFRGAHRASLVAALKDIQQRNTQWRVLTTEKVGAESYGKAMSSTKLFVSPWGYGEWSGKDEEAILAGAILVKPLASCMAHLMPMYEPDVTCLDVRPDWRNLEAVISGALADPERLHRIQRAALEALQPWIGYNRALGSATDAFVQLLSNATSVAEGEFAKPWASRAGRAGKVRGR